DRARVAKKAINRTAGHIYDNVCAVDGVTAKRLGSKAVCGIAIGAQSVVRGLGHASQRVQTGAGRFHDVRSKFSRDHFRHGAAARIAETDEQDAEFTRRRHSEIVARYWKFGGI